MHPKRTYLELTRYVSTTSCNALSPKSQPLRLIIQVGDWIGQVGSAADVFIDAHGVQGFSNCSALESEIILEFAIAKDHHVGNAWFKKRDSHLVTYSLGGLTTFLPQKRSSRAVSNQVVCYLATHIVKKRKFSPRICPWKPSDPVTASQIQSAFKVNVMSAVAAVATDAGAAADSADCIESAWSKLSPLLEAVPKVCSLSKNYKWRAGGRMNRWRSCTREACVIQNLQHPEGGRQDGWC